ncbi:clostripain-related cysteine peptidase [Alistipes sp. OttesenSCG-928-B03]|nr:clostripain-related cysteine peptidase [Alistipes sp. OttesenSCG-928-B03]
MLKNKMFNRFPLAILLLTASILTLGSCIERDIVPCPESSRLLLVYVGTDNNLSGYEQEKLQGLRDGWTGKATDRIIAYVDKGRGADARLIEISNLAPGEQPREIATYGTENSASAITLARVIDDVASMFPSDSYGLLVFSHASGWLPTGALHDPSGGTYFPVLSPSASAATAAAGNSSPLTQTESSEPLSRYYACGGALFEDSEILSRSIVIDGTDEMALSDLAAAIPDGMFDYIAFEACFMAGVEVAWELRHKAPVILASSAEIVHPGFAPVYSSATIKLLGGNLVGFGQSVWGHTLTYAENNPQRSATYSVIRTAGLEPLAAFVRTECDFARTVDITSVQRFDRLNGHRLFFDFFDYHSRLLDTEAQRAELAQLAANCIEWKAATSEFMTQTAGLNGFAITQHSGLTTYIPQVALPGLNAAYSTLGWTNAVMGYK